MQEYKASNAVSIEVGRSLVIKHPLLLALGVIALVWAARTFDVACDILLLGFFSIVLATFFTFPMQLFTRLNIPRGLSVILTLLLLCGVVTGVGFATAPLVSEQASQIRDQLPRALDSIQHWLRHTAQGRALGQIASGAPGANPQAVQQGVSTAISNVGSKLLPAAFGLGEALITCILLTAMAAFLVHTPDLYRQGIRSLVPRSLENDFDEGWQRVGHGLHRWIAGTVISMSIMGGLTAVGLGLTGIHGWYTLALLTFFATFVPYLGSIVSAIPGLAMALAQGPEKLLAAAAVYVGVHIVEGYIVDPMIMRRAVELPPALLLFWQALMGAVFGILGIVVATPLLVVVKLAIGYYYIEQKLGKTPGKP